MLGPKANGTWSFCQPEQTLNYHVSSLQESIHIIDISLVCRNPYIYRNVSHVYDSTKKMCHLAVFSIHLTQYLPNMPPRRYFQLS